MDNFQDIIACLDALAPFVTIAGLLFVYGGKQTRMCVPDLMTIQWVKCFCGPDFYRHITFVTTAWDSHSDDEFDDRQNTFSSLVTSPVVSELLVPPNGQSHSQRFHGAVSYRHGVMEDEPCPAGDLPTRFSPRRHPGQRAQQARAMIKKRYGGDLSGAKLQILKEFGAGTPWNQSEAAKVLQSGSNIWDLKLQIFGNQIKVLGSETTQQDPSSSPRLILGSAQTSQPKKSPEQPEFKPKKTWGKTVIEWLGVLHEAAVFFREARRAGSNPAGAAASGDNGSYNTIWSRVWGRFRERWSRTSGESKGTD